MDEVKLLPCEFLAVAHENAKKPLVAVDIRTGNLGRMGVMWVETTTALAAIEAALATRPPIVTDEVVERVARVLEPQAWAALGTGDTLAYKNRRTSSLRKARKAIAAMPTIPQSLDVNPATHEPSPVSRSRP